ncbi:unnamed protein product [Paramecium octaurelia]|uniref:Uncharacterized protein n=1 Tax=Paramecium octaurelia TaxID=43137 RepID=A0A8S1TR54_PAROT|nr:unnamed protein product [Paramecium octaurelia]
MEINDIINDIWYFKLARKYEQTLQHYREYKIIRNKLDKYFQKQHQKAKIFICQQSINKLSIKRKLLNFLLFVNEG